MPTKSKRSRKPSKRSSSRRAPKVGEQHQLNLEPESPTILDIESEQRVRWGFHMGVCCLVGTGLLALGRVTWREAFDENPKFALKEVVVHTKGDLTPQRIVKAAGLTDGQNVLNVDLQGVRDRISRLPEVRSASLARDFDGKLMIEVEQREPVAWIECASQKLVPMKEGTGCLVDRRGVALPCEVLRDAYRALPVIHVETLDKVLPGETVDSADMRAALKLLGLMSKQSVQRAETIKITRIDMPNSFTLMTKFADGAEVSFGPDGLAQQLVRYMRIREEEEKRGWQIATMNLLAEDNIPVTFKNVASVPSDAPRRLAGGRAGDRTVAKRN